jgi:hypothetical protein
VITPMLAGAGSNSAPVATTTTCAHRRQGASSNVIAVSPLRAGHPASSRADAAPDLTVSEPIAAFWGHAERHYRKHGKTTSEEPQ